MTFGIPFGTGPVRSLYFLILTGRREIVSITLRDGIDFLDDLYEDFGDYYILETGEDWG